MKFSNVALSINQKVWSSVQSVHILIFISSKKM